MAGTDHTQHDHSHSDTVRTDTVRTDGASVTRGAGRDAVAAQHDRFGGIKWGAAFFGWLSANGLAVVLVALLSAAGVALGLAQNVDTTDEAVDQATEFGIGGGIAVLVVLFLAYLAGGYVAGRMARFDGARQGLAVWLVGLIVVLLLAAAGALLGAQYNVLEDLNLPRIPVDEGTATTAGIITLVAILVVTLLGAVLGGKLGDRYHRRVDRAGFAAV
jgi:MFS family permease